MSWPLETCWPALTTERVMWLELVIREFPSMVP